MALFSKDILALDFDHRQLRAVAARLGGAGASVRRMFQESLPEAVKIEDATAFGRWLAGVLSKHHCGGSHTLMAIPRDQVVLKTLMVPAAAPDLEIPALIQFQMQKDLPFAADEAVIDFSLVGESSTAAASPPPSPGAAPSAGGAQPAAQLVMREYLVAATRRDVICYFQQVAVAAGLGLVRLGLRCFSNLQTVRACAPQDVSRRLLLVNVGPELTEIDIIRGGGLVFSRSASVALAERDDPTEFLNRLTLEVIRSVQAARAAVPDLELDGTIVAAPEWLAPSIAERLGQRLDVRGWLLEPSRGISLPAEHSRGAGDFSAALGLVLGEVKTASPGFDFLHPRRPVDLVARRQQHRRLAVIGALGAAAVLVAGNVALLAVAEARNEPAQKRAALLKTDADKVTAFGKVVNDVKHYERSAPQWMDEFRRINDMWMASWQGRTPLHEQAVVDKLTGEMISGGGWRIHLFGAGERADTVVDIRERLRAIYAKPVVIDPAPKPPVPDNTRSGNPRFVYTFDVVIECPAGSGK
ncbi:MAG: pilus assembly protein PilM [Phycisphaerae bacterium]|nr:pilus assembly protein PilM [Phycisphaerae bacterium]